MSLIHLHLEDFRSFAEVDFHPDPDGTTVITGSNGTGKTTLLEALAYLGTQRSFRGAPREVMVRAGTERAIVRAQLTRDELPVLVEAEIVTRGRSRAQVNRQPARTRRDLAEAVRITVFSPDDLAVVRGGPGNRRDVLDDALRVLDHQVAAQMDEVDRALRQRAALLRQAGGRLTPEVEMTLGVWDERLSGAGSALALARERFVRELAPLVDESYESLAGSPAARAIPDPGNPSVTMSYRRSWEGDLVAALGRARKEDLQRGLTSLGPHRDDLVIGLMGRDTRHQASQGEQRSVAVALRLGVHHLIAARTGDPPILLLDDVFSELDPARSRALVHLLPPGQALLTTAVPLPAGVRVGATVDVQGLRRGEDRRGGSPR
ncbi:MAG TPA: DNA replication/repair protein RecF [Acidimicrobiales bacterium]|nr:DNA replication/repair protein RecF [Acidimicrobiales bacterium]